MSASFQIKTNHLRRYGKPIVFAALLTPAVWLVWNWWLAFQGEPSGLGFNPQEASNRFTGDWAMRILLISLGLSPLAKLIKSPKPILFRRMTGLFSFFYVCLHVISYVWLDMLFDWSVLWADVMKRLYITVGFAAFILFIPLAVTSTKGWIKRLSARRWQALHRSVYAIGILVILHFIMMRKGFQIEPLVYGAILLALYALRLKNVRAILTRA